MKRRDSDAPRAHDLAFDLAVIGMALVGAGATVLRANASFCALLGYAHDELLALPPGAIVEADHRQEELARFTAILQGAAPSACATVAYLRRDGQPVPANVTCTRVTGDDGQPQLLVQALAIHTDITERRRADKEIVLLNNLMEQRIRKRTAELEESNEDLRDFAYSLAHDLAEEASNSGDAAAAMRRLQARLDYEGALGHRDLASDRTSHAPAGAAFVSNPALPDLAVRRRYTPQLMARR